MILHVILENPYCHKLSFCRNMESILIDIFLPKLNPFMVGLLYRPPNKPEFTDYQDNSLKK